jgi:hypothetical protein
MSKLIGIIAILSVAGLMGGLYYFLQHQQQQEQQQTRDQLAAAAEWLIKRHQRVPLNDGWAVQDVLTIANNVDIQMIVPEGQAATLLTKPDILRRAIMQPGCPAPEEAVWNMLPNGAKITVSTTSATGKTLAAATCSNQRDGGPPAP